MESPSFRVEITVKERALPSLTRCISVVRRSALDFGPRLGIYKEAGSYQIVIRIPNSAVIVDFPHVRLSTTSLAGSAIFSALAIVLAGASQALGLNFPLIPYLQFDVGEVAIILAFFIFGPVPALVSSFVEFAGLMVFGQQIPIGPLLKLIALLSTVAGMSIGTKVASRGGQTSLLHLAAWSTALGAILRAAAMTVPNFYLIVYLYGPAAIEGYLKAPFSFIGIGLTDANALWVILGFTALFNVMQLMIVMTMSAFVLRVPAVPRIKVGGKAPWFATVLAGGKGRQSEPAF
jgi:riboflavin transporter FmnP